MLHTTQSCEAGLLFAFTNGNKTRAGSAYTCVSHQVTVSVGLLVTRLRNFVSELGLVKSSRCSKSTAPGARCRACDPVFPRALVNRNTVEGRKLGGARMTRG